ncbi:unnamed protein product, partial [Coregonus sp. 'balchen']
MMKEKVCSASLCLLKLSICEEMHLGEGTGTGAWRPCVSVPAYDDFNISCEILNGMHHSRGLVSVSCGGRSGHQGRRLLPLRSHAVGHMEERIIFAVSSKPCLFDTTADSYRDINTVNAAWRQVSTIEKVERTQGQVSEREKGREREEEVWVSSFGSAASGQRPWRFCHILSFLDPFIVPRATSGGNFTARPSTSSTSVGATGASRPSMSSTSATTTGAPRPSTTSISSTSMTTTSAAMEDDEIEEAPLDLGPPEIITL